MANSSTNSRIGLCVICSPNFLEGRAPLGERGMILTNTKGPSIYGPIICKVCDGKGYVYFRSSK